MTANHISVRRMIVQALNLEHDLVSAQSSEILGCFNMAKPMAFEELSIAPKNCHQATNAYEIEEYSNRRHYSMQIHLRLTHYTEGCKVTDQRNTLLPGVTLLVSRELHWED